MNNKKKEILRYGMVQDHYWGDMMMYPQAEGEGVRYEDVKDLIGVKTVKEEYQCD